MASYDAQMAKLGVGTRRGAGGGGAADAREVAGGGASEGTRSAKP